MISYQYSKRILKKAIIKIKDEDIKSTNSLNRVVSKNVYSGINYPSGDNAAFDGYAINSNDTKNIKKNSPKKFKIIGLVDNLNLKSKFGYKIYPERDLKKLSKKIKYAFITVGQINNFKIREKLFKKIEMYGFKTPSIFSPLSYVSKRAKVENGSISF